MKGDVFLATTAVDEFWDKSRRLVFLGEWCKLYNKGQLWGNISSETVPFQWDSTEKTEKGILYCQGVLGRFYRKVTRVLNEYHGIDKDERFYKLLLGTWPFHFIHQLYDKYSHLKKVREIYPEVDTWCLHPDQHYIPIDYEDYCNVSLNYGDDRYQLQIYSDMIEAMGLLSSRRMLSTPLVQKKIYKNKGNKLSISNMCRAITSRLSRDDSVCISAVPLTVREFFSLWARLRSSMYVDNFDMDLEVNMNIDIKYRSESHRGLDADEFEMILSSVAIKHIPLLLLEGMKDITGQVLSKVRKLPTAVLTAQLGNNTARNVYLANKYREIRIYGLQHGGGYGIDKLNSQELYERDVSDLFFVAGWGNGEKTKSLSNIKFIPRNFSNHKAKDILFCLNDLPRFVYRLHFVPMASMYNREYLPDAISFAKKLNNKKELIIRLYPDPARYGNCTDERIKDELPEIRFDDGKRSFHNALSASRLYVSNYFNTSFLEALAANVPSIVFLNKNIFSFSDEARPYIENLYEVEMLQTSPASAANFVDRIYGDVDSWWQSRSVREARRFFIERYIYCAKNWAEEWRVMFKNLSICDAG
ncbi:MAG: LIC12162 family transferase [Syntrophorhabdaceae bacterium]